MPDPPITDGKTLEAGDTDYTGILRHKDPVLCPIASLAFYLSWKFDIEHEPIPDFNDKKHLVPEPTNPGDAGGA